MSVDDAYRRVPTLGLIGDPTIREQTARLTQDAPDYFWSVPASTSGYHHPICREPRGLWAHTLMVGTVLERLAESHVELGRLSWRDVDLARSAAVLHDQRKLGTPPVRPGASSCSSHDLLMAEVVREDSVLPETVAEMVETHMGPWYDGPEPRTALELLVHEADMIASTSTITPAVQGPLPDELEELEEFGLREVFL